MGRGDGGGGNGVICGGGVGRTWAVARDLGVGVTRGVVVGLPVAVGVTVGVVVGVTVGEPVAVGVGLGDGPDCAQYLLPLSVFPSVSTPPQTTISLPIQTAV